MSSAIEVRTYYRRDKATQVSELTFVRAAWDPEAGTWYMAFSEEIPAESRPGSLDLARVYQLPDRHILAHGQVSFQFDGSLVKEEIETIIAQHGLKLDTPLTFAPNAYVAVPVARGMPDAITTANELRKEPGCLWAEPVFIEYIGPRMGATVEQGEA